MSASSPVARDHFLGDISTLVPIIEGLNGGFHMSVVGSNFITLSVVGQNFRPLSVAGKSQLITKMQVNYLHLLCNLRSFKTLNSRRSVKLVIIHYLIAPKPR